MGYRIDYSHQPDGKKPDESQWGNLGWMVIGFFALFLVSTYFFWQEGWTVLKSMLFSGHWTAAKEAAELFVDAVRSGTDFSSAVMGFCEDILSNG